MSLDLLGDANWLAIGAATIAYFGLGALWYAPPVLGKVWMRSIGWEPGPDHRPSPVIYVGPLGGALVAVVATALLAEAAGVDGFRDGLVLWLAVGVGIAGSILFVTGLFEPMKPQPMTWLAVTAGYHLVGLLIAAMIVALW